MFIISKSNVKCRNLPNFQDSLKTNLFAQCLNASYRFVPFLSNFAVEINIDVYKCRKHPILTWGFVDFFLYRVRFAKGELLWKKILGLIQKQEAHFYFHSTSTTPGRRGQCVFHVKCLIHLFIHIKSFHLKV